MSAVKNNSPKADPQKTDPQEANKTDHQADKKVSNKTGKKVGNKTGKKRAKQPVQKPRRRRAWRLLGWLLGSLLIVFSLVCLFMLWLLYSEEGLQLALDVADDYAPGTLQIEGVSGRLAGPLSVQRIEYADDSLAFVGETVSLDWSPAGLVRGNISVQSFTADDITLTLNSTDSAGSSDELPDITLPVDIEVASLDVQKLSIQMGDGGAKRQVQVIRTIHLQADAAGSRVGVQQLTLTYDNVPMDIAVTGDVNLDDGYPLDIQAQWHLKATDDYSSYRGELTAGGRLTEALQGQVTITEPGQVQADYRLQEPLGQLAWQADVAVGRTLLNQWVADAPALTVAAELQAEGDVQQATIERLLVQTLDGDVTAVGQVVWAGDAQTQQPLRWDVRLDGQNVNPETLVPELAGQFSWQSRVQGFLDVQNQPSITVDLAAMQGAFSAPEVDDADSDAIPLPNFSARGELRLQGEQLDVPSLVIDTLDGRIDLSGQAVLSDAIEWQATIHAQRIDLSQYDSYLDVDLGEVLNVGATPGLGANSGVDTAAKQSRLTIRLETTGQLTQGDVNLEATIKTLDGRWQGRAISGTGNVRYAGDWLSVDALLLEAKGAQKNTKIKADGRVKLQQPFAGQLVFDVQVPELAMWVPDVQGGVTLRGRIAGTAQALRLKTDLRVTDLAYAANDIDELTGELDVDLLGRQSSSVKIVMQSADIGGTPLSSATMTFTGNAERHNLQLTAEMAEAKTQLELAGGALSLSPGTLANDGFLALQEGWQGEVRTFTFDTQDLANWRLNKPLSIQFAGQGRDMAVTLERGCFASDQTQSELCMGGKWSDHAGADFSGTIKKVPLQLAEPFIPPEYKLLGQLNGDFQFSAPVGQQPQGRLELTSAAGQIKTRLPTAADSAFRYQNLHVIGNMARGEFRIKGDVDLANDGETKATAEINIRLEDQLPLDGRIKADVNRLAGISIFVPQLTNVQGNAEVDIELAGTVSQPRFDGFIEIDAQRADVIPLGAQIDDLYVRVEANETGKIRLLGEFLAGGGALDFRGQVAAVEDGWQGEIKVQGEKVELLRTPDMKGKFSPNIQIAIDGQTIGIDGDLTLYDTELKLTRFASVTRESNDVIIVGELPSEDDAAAGPLQLQGSVNIITGNPIAVSGEGLEADIEGQLRLALQPEGLPNGRGELSVSGKFEAYGQDLSIENSRIIFADVVVNNPRLQVQALRRVDDVTVGVNITGAAESPRIELFSRPTMTETETLAYLVLGRPLDDNSGTASAAESNTLNNAAAALGAAGGNILGSWVGSRFGIEQVGFESDGEQVDFVLGTQLGKRLFVNFRQGLFEPITALQLQYILNDKCNLEAETSSNGQSVDLTCSFERD